jgi:hypothetical protein
MGEKETVDLMQHPDSWPLLGALCLKKLPFDFHAEEQYGMMIPNLKIVFVINYFDLLDLGILSSDMLVKSKVKREKYESYEDIANEWQLD